ncbi:MAG: hypothetical protein JWR58_2515, partial [Pseudonocardia sp.]|nr:hypothetical protein [Pseudonocardia sp.]
MLLETRADDGGVDADLEARARAMLEGAALMHGLTAEVELIGSVTTARADPSATRTMTGAVDLVGVIGAQVLGHLMPQPRSRSNPRVVKRA